MLLGGDVCCQHKPALGGGVVEGEGALGLGPGEPWRHGGLIVRCVLPSFAVLLLLSVAPVAVRVIEKTAIT